MTLKELIDMFLNIVKDDKIYFDLIDGLTNEKIIEKTRLFNEAFEPYHDRFISSVKEIGYISRYEIIIRSDDPCDVISYD